MADVPARLQQSIALLLCLPVDQLGVAATSPAAHVHARWPNRLPDFSGSSVCCCACLLTDWKLLLCRLRCVLRVRLLWCNAQHSIFRQKCSSWVWMLQVCSDWIDYCAACTTNRCSDSSCITLYQATLCIRFLSTFSQQIQTRLQA